MRRLAQEFARAQIEQAFVAGGAVAAHDGTAGGHAVGVGFAQEVGVARLLGDVEDDAYIHHDVDKERILGDERTQILAFLFEAHTHRFPRLDDHLVQRRVARQVVPAFPGHQNTKPRSCTLGSNWRASSGRE